MYPITRLSITTWTKDEDYRNFNDTILKLSFYQKTKSIPMNPNVFRRHCEANCIDPRLRF